MAKYKAATVAHWFIKRNVQAMEESSADNMTLMKLLKLLYYAEGCALAINSGIGLFDEDIVAWEHGPVVVEVYSEYCRNPYHLPLTDTDSTDAETIEPDDQNLLEQVYQIFGQYSASGLRNKTHAESPWLEATNNGAILKKSISRETMREYFLENYIEAS